MERTPNESQAFVILQTAVDLARQFQIKEAKSLVWRLNRLYPDKDAEIKLALTWWVDYAEKKDVNEKDRYGIIND